MRDRVIVLEQGRKLREEYKTYTEACRVVDEQRFFIKVVNMINAELVDPRLDTTDGIVEVLREIQQHNLMHGEITIPVINGELNREGKLRVFFEV